MHQSLSKEIKFTNAWQTGQMDGWSDFGGGDKVLSCFWRRWKGNKRAQEKGNKSVPINGT
jgi:hypothetical protein